MANKCPICNSDEAEEERISGKGLVFQYTCPRCGVFDMDVDFRTTLSHLLEDDDRKISVLSHWIRSKHEARKPDKLGHYEMLLLNELLVESILDQRAPSPSEQSNNFVRWLGENIDAPGEEVLVAPSTHQAIMGAQTPNGFALVIGYLFNAGIIIGQRYVEEVGKAHVTLSFEGWKHFEELKSGAIDSQKVFMAMQYGDEKLDKIVNEVFKPAVKQTGFDLFRLADRPKAGLIDDRLRVEIQTSRFLIADLTHENAGAYWEAGYAEGLGKPVIYTCETEKFDEQKTHFDTNHHLTVVWDYQKPVEAGEELKATIRATLPDEVKLIDE